MTRRAWIVLAVAAVSIAACVRSLEGAYCDADDSCGPSGSGYLCELPGRLCVAACPATHERCADVRCVPAGTCSAAIDGGDSGTTDAGGGGGGGSGDDGGSDGGLDGGADAGLQCDRYAAPLIITPRSTFLPKTATSYVLTWETSAPSGCEMEITEGTQCAIETDGGWGCAFISALDTTRRFDVTASPRTLPFSQSPGSRYLQLRVCEPQGSNVCGPRSLIRTIQVGRTIGDIDGDGKADVIVGTSSASMQLVEYLSSLNFNGQSYPVGAIGTAASVSGIGDYDGDGLSDVVIVGDAGNSMRRPVVLKGDPSGLSSSFQENPGGTELTAWGVGDVSGDGFMDIAILDPGRGVATLRLSLGSKAISVEFTATLNFLPQFATGVGDLNADGIDDFAVVGNSAGNPQVLVFAGRASFGRDTNLAADTPVTLSPPGGATSFGYGVAGLGDIDGDGCGDFVVGHAGTASGPYVYRGSRTQLVQPGNSTSNHLGPIYLRAAAQLNDGGYTFVFPTSQGSAVCEQSSLTTSNCTSAGAGGPLPNQFGFVGDVNADGRGDVALVFEGQTPVWHVYGWDSVGSLTLYQTAVGNGGFTSAGHLLATFPSP